MQSQAELSKAEGRFIVISLLLFEFALNQMEIEAMKKKAIPLVLLARPRV